MNESVCGEWPLAELARHAVTPHTHEWLDGGEGRRCCRPRRFERWTTDDKEGRLLDGSLRLLVLITSDSSNVTQARTLANAAAFSQLREAAATFLVVVDNCASWSTVRSAMALLGVLFECVPRPTSAPSQAQPGMTMDSIPSCHCSSTV